MGDHALRGEHMGVMGCEMWDTSSPYVAEFTGADAGKTVYYMLRWVTTRGEKGPRSETVAATITG